jgi:leader peptidase (prepilin peptidase) / N-methyltransferase
MVALIAVLGLAIGSFVNVVIVRVPRGQSLVSPASRCPVCDRPIRARHNVPLLGWLILRGRCANCRARISIQYPLVELTTAVLFAATAARMQALNLLPALPAYLYFVAIGVSLAVIDLQWRRLPNAIVVPSYPVLAVLLAAATAWRHDWGALSRAGIGAALLFSLFWAIALIQPRAMGYGDVKLAGIVGGVLAYLSWPALAVGAFAGFALGALVGLALIASRHGHRKTAIPFGPFMVAGTLLTVLTPIAALTMDLLAAP